MAHGFARGPLLFDLCAPVPEATEPNWALGWVGPCFPVPPPPVLLPCSQQKGHLLATGILLKSNWQSATHIALRRKEPYFSNTCWGTLRGRYQLFRMKGPHRFDQQFAEDSHDNGLIGGNNWSQKEHPCLGCVLHQPALRFCHQRFSVLLATGSL